MDREWKGAAELRRETSLWYTVRGKGAGNIVVQYITLYFPLFISKWREILL
jgi:hypothetical protein